MAILQRGPEYPKTKFHPTLPPKVVMSADQESKLDSEWRDQYIFQEFPKHKYHPIKPSTIVNTAEEEKKLGAGWFDQKGEAEEARAKQLEVVGTHHIGFLRAHGQVNIKTIEDAKKFVENLSPGGKKSFMEEAASWTPEKEDWRTALPPAENKA